MEWFRLTQEAPWLQVCCPDEVQRALVQRVWRNLPHIAPTNTLGSDSRDTVEQISSVMVAQVLEVGVINSMYKASLRKRSSCAPREFLGHEHGFDTKPGQSQRHINVSPKAKQAEAPPTDAFMVASQIVNSAIDKGVVRTICPRRDSFQGDYASLANIIVNEAIRAGIKRAMQAPQDGSDSERVSTRITSHPEEKKQTESPVHFAIAREIMEAAVEAGVVRALTPFDEDEFQSPAAELQKSPQGKARPHLVYSQERLQPAASIGQLKPHMSRKAIHAMLSARRTTFADTPTYYSQPNSPIMSSEAFEMPGRPLAARQSTHEPRIYAMPRTSRCISEAKVTDKSVSDAKARNGRRLRGATGQLTAWGNEEEGDISPESSFRQPTAPFSSNGVQTLLSDLLDGPNTSPVFNLGDLGGSRVLPKNSSLTRLKAAPVTLFPVWAISSATTLDASMSLESSPRQALIQSKGSASSLSPSTSLTSPAVATGIGSRAFTALQRLKDSKGDHPPASSSTSQAPSEDRRVSVHSPAPRSSWSLPSPGEATTSAPAPLNFTPTPAPMASSQPDPGSQRSPKAKNKKTTREILFDCTKEQTFDLESVSSFSKQLGVRDQWTLAWKRKGSPNGSVEFESAKAVSRELMQTRSPSFTSPGGA
jgi:hypothetical protein